MRLRSPAVLKIAESCSDIKNEKEVSIMVYKTRGVCSQKIDFDVEDGKVRNVKFLGGCNGNLQGIGALIEGMEIDEAISRLSGIRCGFKNTSCPDQLACALKSILGEK